MEKIKLSVTIITLNEEKNIKKCIDSVREIADEIVVVDSGSIDKTVKIAKKLGVRVYHRDFDNFSNQKNYAAKKARGDWILSLDADEAVTSELASEIGKAIKAKDVNGYLIPRRNIIFGAEIRHTRWSPDRHVWLWRRGKGQWLGEVHEEVVVDGCVGQLKMPKIHYQYKTVKGFLKMINNYTTRESKELVSHKGNFSYIELFFAPIRSFFGRFFLKGGFLDGWRGFVLSYLMGIYRVATWVKVWERVKTRKSS